MTKPANDPNKPSPSDTPTHRPDDKGHKAIMKERDKEDNDDEANFGNVNKQYREDEQPVHSVKKAPKDDEGMQEGKVQP